MKKLLLLTKTLLAVALLCVGQNAWGEDTTWTFKDNTAVWAADGVTLKSGNQYDKDAKATDSGGVTFTGTSGFVSTAKGIGFYATGSTSNENISIVVPAGYKATVSIYTSNNRTVIADFGGATQTYNASWASSTKEFNNKDGESPVTLYLYCNQNPGGDNQKNAPFVESIILTDLSGAGAYPWTANAVATINNEKTTIKTYSSAADVDEDSNYTIVVDKVIKYDGNYYELSDATFASNVFGKNYTMGQEAAEYEYTYVKVDDAVFYGEAEDIYSAGSGANKSTGSTVLSNGAGYYVIGSNDNQYASFEFSVPAAGFYKISVGMNNTNSSDRGFNYSIDGAAVSETITVSANSPYVQNISCYLESGDHTLKLNKTYSLTPIFDYVLVHSMPAPEGKFYLKNKANNGYFGAGLNYGTKAMTSSIGHTVTLSYSDGKYTIDTSISNGGDSHYLNGVWNDGAAFGWTLISDGAGYYTISDGTNNLTAGAIGAEITLASSTGDNAKWQLLTEAEWKAEQVARLDAATSSNGVDATFYIPAANFNRNDNTENAKWQGSPKIDGLSENSANTNYNAEKYNTTFDVYQELTDLKPGIYKLTAQGFYRNGDAGDADASVRNAILYANSTEAALVNVVSEGKAEADADHGFTTLKSGKYIPNSQTDASKAFNAGNYVNELFVVVGEDGALRVGVKKTTAVTNDWTVFDNFQLTYYGNTVSATIGAMGYTTFSSSYPLNLGGISGGTAYKVVAADISGTVVTPSAASGTIAAGEGLLLNGEAGAAVTIPVAASGEAIDGNLMVGCPTGATITSETPNYDKLYVLINGDTEAKFANLTDWIYGGNDVTIPANKAYLYIPSLSARSMTISFGGLTGVDNVEAASEAKAKEGKFIENGKLIIVKNGKKFNAAGAKLY